MKFLIICLFIASANADLLNSEPSEAWNEFKVFRKKFKVFLGLIFIEIFQAKFGKVYPDDYSERHHYRNFLGNREEVKEHNQKYSEGLVSYFKGINQYSDLVKEKSLIKILN